VEELRQPTHERFVIADPADAGAVRRTVARYAGRLAAATVRTGPAELVATELATNLLRHAKPGGSGIADLPAAVEGRTPTPGGLGRGLAAVRRAAAVFDVHSEVGRGTAVLAVVDLTGPDQPRPRPPRQWAGISVGLTEACGDAWAAVETDGGLTVAVVDGLGHGPRASTAADAALAVLAAGPVALDRYLDRANAALRDTRGAAVAVCRIRPDRGELSHVGLGNISGRIVVDGGGRGLASHPGTLGMSTTVPRVPVTTHPCPPGATLVLWTDGLTSRLDPARDAALLARDPAVIAATLYREHSRERDDATIVVARAPTPT
jgi:anti-sigma regulatory factor (Ser/Thr protein kinase)